MQIQSLHKTRLHITATALITDFLDTSNNNNRWYGKEIESLIANIGTPIISTLEQVANIPGFSHLRQNLSRFISGQSIEFQNKRMAQQRAMQKFPSGYKKLLAAAAETKAARDTTLGASRKLTKVVAKDKMLGSLGGNKKPNNTRGMIHLKQATRNNSNKQPVRQASAKLAAKHNALKQFQNILSKHMPHLPKPTGKNLKRSHSAGGIGIAYDYVGTVGRSTIKATMVNDRMIVSCSQLITHLDVDTSLPVGTTIFEVLINPTQVMMGGVRETRYASTYDKFDVKDVEFKYVPARATTTNGSFYGSFSFDPDEYDANTEDGLKKIMTKPGSHGCAFYVGNDTSSCHWRRPAWPGRKPTFFVDTVGSTSADVRLSNEGKFTLKLGYGCDPLDGKMTMGAIWCHTVVEFYDPTIGNLVSSTDMWHMPAELLVEATFPDPVPFLPPLVSNEFVPAMIAGSSNSTGAELVKFDATDNPTPGASSCFYVPPGVWNLAIYGGIQFIANGVGNAVLNWQWWNNTSGISGWSDFYSTGGLQPKTYSTQFVASSSIASAYGLTVFPSARCVAAPGADWYVRPVLHSSSNISQIAYAATVADPIYFAISFVSPTSREQVNLAPTFDTMLNRVSVIEQKIAEWKEIISGRAPVDLQMAPGRNEEKKFMKPGSSVAWGTETPFDIKSIVPPPDDDESDNGTEVESVYPLPRIRALAEPPPPSILPGGKGLRVRYVPDPPPNETPKPKVASNKGA